MKKHFCLTLLLCAFFLTVHAQLPAAVTDTLTLLAARGDATALRPLFAKTEKTLPRVTRLYCRMALARADGDYPRMVASIDTLLQEYPRRLGKNGRLDLVELKAFGLLHDGRYDELAAFCRKELAYCKKRRFKQERLARLQAYEKKGRRLSGHSLRARLLSLADRGQVFELAALFQSAGDSVDAYAHDRAALALAAAFGRDGELQAVADTLLTQYPDSLDEEDRILCFRSGADALARQGCWPALASFLKRHSRPDISQSVPLRQYQLWSEAWRSVAPFRLDRPSRAFSVPTSRDWPLLAHLSLNGSNALPFLIDTGEGHTLVTAETARKTGLRVLSDTVMLSTSIGLVAASSAMTDSLSIGEAVMRRLPVYVVAENARWPKGFAGILGNSELSRMGTLRFFEEKLVFPEPAARTGAPAPPNMRLSASGSLLVAAACENATRLFGLDTGNAGNVFSSIVFPRATTDTLGLNLAIGKETFTVPFLTLQDTRRPDRDGALGMPFLRSFHDVTLDYAAMRITPSQPQEYRPLQVFDYIERSDFFGLERNAEALSAVIDAHDEALMRLHIDGGKNCPDHVAEKADSLLQKLDRNASRNASDEYEYLMVYRINALVSAGRYKEAAEAIVQADKEGLHSGNMRDMLLDIGITCQTLSSTPALSIEADGKTRSALPFETDEDGQRKVAIRTGRKTALAAIDPSLEVTSMSEKTAKSLRLRIVRKHTVFPYAVAIADSLCLGGFTARHVLCHVYPGREQQTAIGFNLLRHFSRVAFTRDSLSLSLPLPLAKQQPELPKGHPLPLRFDDKLYTEGESDHHCLTFALTPSGKCSIAKRRQQVRLGDNVLSGSDFVPGDYTADIAHTDGVLSLDYLVRKTGCASFDFPRMRLFLGTPPD